MIEFKVMKRKIFVSYKYSDRLVKDLNLYETEFLFNPSPTSKKNETAPRHYVDELVKVLGDDNQIYKGEDDRESLDSLADSTIASKLGDKIFDSSVNLVLVSKGMKKSGVLESKQWIPWEVSYSLKNQTRLGRTSNTNAVVVVVLPDESDKYDYYISWNDKCDYWSLNLEFLFQILSDNIHNAKEPKRRWCNNGWVYEGDCSYIQSVKWDDFILKPLKYIEKAVELKNRIEEFEIVKTIK